MITEVKGDLILQAAQFDVIAHGANCFCEMKSGIAKQVVLHFPEAQQVDLQTIKGDRNKLGTITHTTNTTPVVVNAYTQYNFGTDKIQVDYHAVRSCMQKIKASFTGKKIGLPQIGAGLAGGDWGLIRSIIFEELSDEEVVIVYWQPAV